MVELSFYLNLNFSRLKWQKNLNFTSEFITLSNFFSVRNFITLILVAGLATSVSKFQNSKILVAMATKVVATWRVAFCS